MLYTTFQSHTEPGNNISSPPSLDQPLELPSGCEIETSISIILLLSALCRLTHPPESVLKHHHMITIFSYLICEDLSPAGPRGNWFPVHFDLRG